MPTYFFTKNPVAFYVKEISGDAIPEDAVEITEEEHAALLVGQAAGKVISGDAEGRPILIDQAAPSGQAVAMAAIMALEATVTQRRLRDAILGTDGGWLKDVEAKISVLRSKL
jgi:hypothetical protein